MTTFLKSKLNAAMSAAFINFPSIGAPAVLDGINAGGAVTFTAATGVAGYPTPTVTNALYKNGTLVNANYTSGTYNTTATNDQFKIVTTVSNGFGTPAVATSTTMVVGVTQTFVPTILANPVIGKALSYTTPGYAGTITSQQWYRNKGAGPVLIPGATGATYTPSKTSALGDSDVGGFFSVHVTTPTGVAASQEFTAFNQVLSQTGQLAKTSPTGGSNFIATEATPVTIQTVCTVRLNCPNGPNPTFYIDTTVAPGTYAGGTATFGDPSLLGGSQFSSNVYTLLSYSSPACIDQVAAKPSTATRPGTSTGVGFFTKNGALYDAGGNLFLPWGLNRLHWDCNRPGNDTGLFNAKANIHRIFMDFSQSWASVNKPLMDAMVSNHVVPNPVIPYCRANFEATFSDTTMTVTTMNSGVIAPAPSFSSGAGGGFISTGVSSTTVIKAQLTNTNPSGIPGKEGTYTTSTTNNIGSSQNVVYSNGTTGQNNAEFCIAAAQMWVDQVANWQPYERQMILNIINEWGPVGTASNTVWRDTYITAVQMLRTAGYKGTIMIDAPGSGQDGGSLGRAWTLLNHSAAILAADPEKNLCFSLHCYGVYQAGWLAATAQALAAQAAAANTPFLVGEFGPANQNGAAGSITTAQALETMSVCAANGLGCMLWAWDDPVNATSTTITYFAACLRANSNYFATSTPADLTTTGQQVVLDAQYGLTHAAVAATVFP